MTIVYILDSDVGFYCGFFFLCKAWLYAREQRHDFYIDSSAWCYKYKDGWHDYFTSLTEFNPARHIMNVKRITRHDLIKYSAYSLQKYQEAFQALYRVKPEILQKAVAFKDSIEKPYSAILIRRGDKIQGPMKEMDELPIEEILVKSRLTLSTGILFVQTDDTTIVPSLQALRPDMQILHRESGQDGFFLTDFSKWAADEKRKHTEDLLIDTEVLLSAEEASTDTRSNTGRFHRLMGLGKVLGYPIHESIASLAELVQPYFSVSAVKG